MKVLGVVTDPVATDGKRIGDGAFGVGWMAAAEMQVLLFVGGLNVYRCFEFTVGKGDVYV